MNERRNRGFFALSEAEVEGSNYETYKFGGLRLFLELAIMSRSQAYMASSRR